MKVKQVFLFLWLVLLAACAESNDKSPQTKTQELVKEDTLTSFLDSSWEQIEGTPVWIRKDIFDSSVFTKTDSLVAGRIYVDDVTDDISYRTGGRFDWFFKLTYEDYSDVLKLAMIGYWPTFSRSYEKMLFEELSNGKGGHLVYTSIVHGKHFLEYRCTSPFERNNSHDRLVVTLYKVYVYHNKVVRIDYARVQHKDSVSYKEHDYVLSCIRIKLD